MCHDWRCSWRLRELTLGFALAILSSTGEGIFRFEQQARAHCPSDTVVWINTFSQIYHYAGSEYYGNTKFGNYSCELDAKAAGNRAARNERHP